MLRTAKLARLSLAMLCPALAYVATVPGFEAYRNKSGL